MKSTLYVCLVGSLVGCSVAAKLKGGGASSGDPEAVASRPADETPAPQATPQTPPAAAGDTTDIPEILVRHIRDSYGDSPESQENNVAMLRGAARAFGPAWSAYQARKKKVDQVIARAAAQEKAGQLAEAEATLTELLGPVPRGGPTWKDRGILEPADADFPALEALARIAVARRTDAHTPIPTVLRVAQAMWGRRAVGERGREQLVWLAQCPVGYSSSCKEEFKTAAERVRWFSSSDTELQAAIASAEGAEKQGRKRALELLGAVLYEGRHPTSPPAQVMKQIIDQSGYERWPKLFDESGALIASFEAAWQPYAARRAAVLAAVQQAGTGAGARTRLEALIAPVPRDAAGQLVARRWIEERDAELPAIQALAEALRAGKQWRAFVELGTAFRVRRSLEDADGELSRHILRAGKLEADGSFDPQGGDRLARAHWERLDQLGIAAGAPEAELEVRRGTPMLLVLPASNWQSKAETLTIKDRSIKFKMTIDGNDKRCKVTSRVDRIEDDGTVRYVEECTYTPKKIHYTAEIRLAESAPTWASSARRLHIFGILSANGGPRSWKLVDAAILDLRYE